MADLRAAEAGALAWAKSLEAAPRQAPVWAPAWLPLVEGQAMALPLQSVSACR